MTADERLLPCPFCGAEPYTIPDDSYDGYYVGCLGCDLGFMATSAKSAEAIDAWNRRVPTEREARLVALLRRAVATRMLPEAVRIDVLAALGNAP